MPTAQTILERKGADVATMDRDASVLDAAKLMNSRHIGALVVNTGDRIIGIFTERDILNRVVAVGADPNEDVRGKHIAAHRYQIADACEDEVSLLEIVTCRIRREVRPARRIFVLVVETISFSSRRLQRQRRHPHQLADAVEGAVEVAVPDNSLGPPKRHAILVLHPGKLREDEGRRVAAIAVETTLSAAETGVGAERPEPRTPEDGIAVTFGGGAGSGQALFLVEEGALLSCTLETTMKLEARIREPLAPPEGPGARNVRSEVHQRLSVERLP